MSQSGNKSFARRFNVDDAISLVDKSSLPKGTEILNFYLKAFSTETLGYVGLHQLMVIEVCQHNRAKSKKILTFFVKTLQPTSNTFLQMVTREELKFFNDVMPRFLEDYKSEPWGAKCYLIKDKSLVLEDLRYQGFEPVNKLSDQQLKIAVTTLARFHASSMILEDKMQKPLSQVFPGYFKQKMFKEDEECNWMWLLAGINVVENVARNLGLDSKYVLRAYDMLMELIKPKDSDVNVLCHGDLWSNNILFNDKGTSCRLVDFQMVVYASYAVDLLQLMYLNANQNRRKRLEKELIQLYYNILSETLQKHHYDRPILSVNKILETVESMRIIGIVTAAQCFPIVLLNKDMNEEFVKDDEKFQEYMYVSRKEFVMEVMRLDDVYRTRIEQIVKELIKYMKNIE